MTTSILEKNMACLNEVNPELANRLIGIEDDPYEIVKGNGGKRNLRYLGVQPPVLFYDPIDPEGQIKSYLDETAPLPSRFLVLLGLGLGYPALKLLRRKDELLKLIIVERDLSCLKKALEEENLTALIGHPAVRLIGGCEEDFLYVTLYKAVHPHYPGFKEMRFLPWPASVRIHQNYYAQVMRTFRQIVDTHVADRGNDPYDTLVAYEHFFANIQELLTHPGAGHVKDLFTDRPAVVVATGPSLKKNIHLLKGIEDRAVILSVDASLRILDRENIRPHLVTTVERPPGFNAYYQGLRHLDLTVFAAASFVHPSTLKAYTGPRIFFHRLYNFMKHLGFAEDAIHMGMSTANMAYEVARHMGCNPIVLVGNDLAYDSSGHTHAPGFILGEKQPVYQDFDQFDVPGNVEPWVKTCDGWFSCLKQYEKRIADHSGLLINATEGGARIRGSTIMTLQEAIDRYCQTDFQPRRTLLDHLATWKNPRTMLTLLQTINRFLEVDVAFIDICRKIRPPLAGILHEIEGAGERLPIALVKEIEATLPHVETVLNQIVETPLMQYFDEYLNSDLLPLLMEWQVISNRFSSPAWEKAYRIKLADNFFGGLGQLCLSLKTVLQQGVKALEATPA